MQATLDEVAAEVEQLERDGMLAAPRPVDDAPDAAEVEDEEGLETGRLPSTALGAESRPHTDRR